MNPPAEFCKACGLEASDAERVSLARNVGLPLELLGRAVQCESDDAVATFESWSRQMDAAQANLPPGHCRREWFERVLRTAGAR